MARYYFDIKDGKRERDHEGVELASADDAVAHARQLARKVAKDRAPAPDEAPLFISIVHESGLEMDQIPVSGAV